MHEKVVFACHCPLSRTSVINQKDMATGKLKKNVTVAQEIVGTL